MPERMPLAGVALDAEHHFDPPGGIELVDHVRRHVGGPDIVLGIDPQPMRALEQPVAEAADEMTVRIEFHQRHRPAMDDEDVAFGIEGDARGAAKIHAGWQFERFGNRDVGKWWRFHSRRASHAKRSYVPLTPPTYSAAARRCPAAG